MSYTEIYKFKSDGYAEMVDETKNAFRGCMAIWSHLETKYLPKYQPSWARSNDDTNYSRTSNFDSSIKEIWNLYDDERLSPEEKLVLRSTFDNVIVNRENVHYIIDSFRSFDGETSLKEQADIIEKLLNEDEDFIAIGWNQTSVNVDAWVSMNPILRGSMNESHPYFSEYEDYDDVDPVHLPYNILTQTDHYEIFD